jgi:hypothetical protein
VTDSNLPRSIYTRDPLPIPDPLQLTRAILILAQGHADRARVLQALGIEARDVAAWVTERDATTSKTPAGR